MMLFSMNINSRELLTSSLFYLHSPETQSSFWDRLNAIHAVISLQRHNE